MAREIIMGIDIGTSAVKTVILEKLKTDSYPHILGTGLSLSQGLRKGYVVNPEEVAPAIKNSIKQAQETSGINIKHAYVSVGGASLQALRSKASIAVSRADNEISENDVKRAIKQSEAQLNRSSSASLLNREILHFFPLSFKIDGELVLGDPVGMRGEKLEVETLFATCLSQHLNNLVKSMDLAKINIEDIVAAPYAMSHSLLGRQEKEVGSIVINVGGDTSSIIIFEEGLPISMEIFPIGSNHITYDIARGFQIPLNEAEDLKLSYGSDSGTKRKLQSIIEPRLSDIFELVENHLNKINRSGLLPAGSILTGGGANLQNIEEVAKKSLVLPSQLSKPKFINDHSNPIANPIWSVALGLCYTDFSGNGMVIDSGRVTSKIKKTVGRCVRYLLP
jgi:cell division protein FtsA